MAKIRGKQIADGEITTAQMGTNSVDSDELVDGSIDLAHVSGSARTGILDVKRLASWIQVGAFSTVGGTSSDDVTTAIEAVAATDIPRNIVGNTGILSTGSTLTDTTASAIQNYKVQIRTASDDQPIDDGSGGEVFGVLSSAASVWTLNYYKAGGSAHTITAATSIDFLFAEIFNFSELPGTSLLSAASFGDISDIAGTHNHDSVYHTKTKLASTTNGEGAAFIGVEDASSYYTGTDLEVVLNEIEAQLGGATSTTFNFTEANVLTDNDALYAALEKLDLKWGDLASTNSGEGASLVGVFDTAGNFTGTDVEAVLAELFTAIGAVATATIVNADRDAASAATTGNGQDTVVNITSAPKGDVLVLLNGIKQVLGDGVKTKDCYFSVDSGTTARAISAIAAADSLYWNGTVAGFDLDASDKIDLVYET